MEDLISGVEKEETQRALIKIKRGEYPCESIAHLKSLDNSKIISQIVLATRQAARVDVWLPKKT